MSDLKQQIEDALKQFAVGSPRDSARKLLNVLGYDSDKTVEIEPNTWEGFKDLFLDNESTFNAEAAMVKEWKGIDIIFQLTDEELSGTRSLFQTNEVKTGLMSSYVFFAIHLKGQRYARGKLAQITRQLNRVFPMPVMVFFVYNGLLSIAVINRRRNKRDAEKDVLGKVTLIQEISLFNPHRGHRDILASLATTELSRKRTIKSFDDLHASWSEVFDIELLNKKFYQRIAEWFFYAVDHVQFPHGGIENESTRNRIALIRMLTRIIFCWFAKEKGLISPDLFESKISAKVLKEFDPFSMEDGSYYKAILQNLFFPTLSVPLNEREFRNGKRYKGVNKHYMQHNFFRHEELFKDAEKLGRLFANIPFLNGGLFECLDYRDQRGGDNKEVRVDGFSDNPNKQPKVPNALFFGKEMSADLSEAFDSPKKASVKVDGLFHILDSYKFTVTENTPIEEEIALDPELLGRIFENLLAQYNPETEKTARKETGSFYTPRTIVDYMVNESLKAYLKQQLVKKLPDVSVEDAQAGLDILFSYSEKEHAFTPIERQVLVDAIYDITILDPACGSGAFPIGMLQKLVYVLEKLDHDHDRWKERILKDTPPAMREDTRELLERSTAEYNWKLGLIQHCIYGVDIQPIAVQIAKLRCFIALLVDFDVHPDKENFGVPALPNLEFKFVAADTLINPPGAQREGDLFGMEDPFFADFAKAAEEYFFVREPKEKEKLRSTIEALIEGKIAANEKILANQRGDNHSNATIRDAIKSKNKAAIARVESDIVLWESYRNLFAKRNDHVKFFDMRYFFPEITDGFDVVIGNPPYISLEDFTTEQKQQFAENGYVTLAARGDVYCLFYERGGQLLKPNGHLCYITSNKWMRSNYGEVLREFLSSKVNTTNVLDFGMAQNFGSATTYTCILQFEKSTATSTTRCCYASDDKTAMADPSSYFKTYSMEMTGLDGNSWVVISPERYRIKQLVEQQGKPLEKWALKINRGVTSGYNDAYYLTQKQREDLLNVEPQAEDLIVPVLRGRDIERYCVNFAEWYLLVIKFGAHKTLEKDYPYVYAHLKQFEDKLRKRGQCSYSRTQTKNTEKEFPGQHHWLELDNNLSDDNVAGFRKPKIIYQEIAQKLPFYFDREGYFTNDTCYIATSDEEPLEYLTAVYNSSLFRCCFKDNFPENQGNAYRMKKVFFDKIQIKKPDTETAIFFKMMVTAVQLAKRWEGVNSPTPAVVATFLEEVIDACIMEVYFADHMRERKIDLISHVRPLLPTDLSKLNEAEQWRKIATFFEHANAPDHSIRNRLMRLSADSPELLAIIKEEGKV